MVIVLKAAFILFFLTTFISLAVFFASSLLLLLVTILHHWPATYSFSFSEPWLGGEKPVQFSTSISQTKQYLYNRATRSADKNRSFNITGITLGIAKKLNVPDDYFVLSQSFQYQYYDLNNYNTGLFTFGDGSSNNLAYTVGLSRNNTYNDPIYPIGGSNFSVSAKLTFPYSAFNGAFGFWVAWVVQPQLGIGGRR